MHGPILCLQLLEFLRVPDRRECLEVVRRPGELMWTGGGCTEPRTRLDGFYKAR